MERAAELENVVVNATPCDTNPLWGAAAEEEAIAASGASACFAITLAMVFINMMTGSAPGLRTTSAGSSWYSPFGMSTVVLSSTQHGSGTPTVAASAMSSRLLVQVLGAFRHAEYGSPSGLEWCQ